MSTRDLGPAGSDALAVLQADVYRRLGQCVVRLQEYELLMKALLSRHRVEGPSRSISASYEERAEYLAQRTLGQLVGAFTSSVTGSDWDQNDLLSDTPTHDEPRIGIGFKLTLHEADQQAVKTSLTTLVQLRNDLVHGFIAMHDISTQEGCRDAASYLGNAHKQVGRHLDQLRALYVQMSDGYKELARTFGDPKISDYVFHGILPDSAGVHWPASTIVGLLRHAEGELAEDGWTQLDAAVKLIRGLAPEHTPSRYGCSSWRQVLHEARPLFVVRRDPGGGFNPGETWYQSAEQAIS